MAGTTYTANFTRQYLLTTGIVPGGSGTVTSTPSSADGYYDSGTSVQLQAAPSGGFGFFNWLGDLTGTANPQNLSMSAPRLVTANFQATGSAGSFITCIAGNSQTHTVQLVNAATSAVVASASVNMAGCTAGGFVYTPLGSAVALSAGASYYLASQEANGGDSWFDLNNITATSAATANNSVYFFSGAWQAIGGGNTSYVPANLLYQIAP